MCLAPVCMNISHQLLARDATLLAGLQNFLHIVECMYTANVDGVLELAP